MLCTRQLIKSLAKCLPRRYSVLQNYSKDVVFRCNKISRFSRSVNKIVKLNGTNITTRYCVDGKTCDRFITKPAL